MTALAAGDAVCLTGVRQNALLPTFPGWGHPEEYDHFRRVEDGERGTITDVESHGMSPWTRYSIVLEDGSRMYGTPPDQVRAL